MINILQRFRQLILFLCLALAYTLTYSQQITQSQARKIAEKYMGKVTSSPSLRGFGDTPSFYVFNKDKGGFIIVSADERLTEIVGYSNVGRFDSDKIPNELGYYLKNYSEYVSLVRNNKVQGHKTRLLDIKTEVAPLLKSEWGQTYPYNLLTPKFEKADGDSVHSPTGCVATAISQVMYYHKWPAKGTGEFEYTLKDVTEPLRVDFSKSEYHWDKMYDTYSDSYKAEDDEPVAKLMYDVGVAVEMSYGLHSSGAYTEYASRAMQNHFSYLTRFMSRSNYTTEQFTDSIKYYLNKQIPILYDGASKNAHINGSAHAWVVDGYDNNGFVHCNWGWDSLSNGYFNMNYMNPSVLGTGGGRGGFLNYQNIIIAIPKRGEYKDVETINDYSLSISGRIRYEHQSPSYDVLIIDKLKSNSRIRMPFKLGVRLHNEKTDTIIGFKEEYKPINWSLAYNHLNIDISNAIINIGNGEYELHLMYDKQDGSAWSEVYNQPPITIKKGAEQTQVIVSPIDISYYKAPKIKETLYAGDINPLTIFLDNKSKFDMNTDMYIMLDYMGDDKEGDEDIELKVNEDINLYDNTKVHFSCPFILPIDDVKKYGLYRVRVRIESRTNSDDSIVLDDFEGKALYVNVEYDKSRLGDMFVVGLAVHSLSGNTITDKDSLYLHSGEPFMLDLKIQNTTDTLFNSAIGIFYEDRESGDYIWGNLGYRINISSVKNSTDKLYSEFSLRYDSIPSQLVVGKTYNIKVVSYDRNKPAHFLPIKDIDASDYTNMIVVPTIKEDALTFSNLSLYEDNESKELEKDIVLYDDEDIPTITFDVDIKNNDYIAYASDIVVILEAKDDKAPLRNIEVARFTPNIGLRKMIKTDKIALDISSILPNLLIDTQYNLVFTYNHWMNSELKTEYKKIDSPSIIVKKREGNQTYLDSYNVDTTMVRLVGSNIQVKSGEPIKSVKLYSISGVLLKSIRGTGSKELTINTDDLTASGVVIVRINNTKSYKVIVQ